MTDFHEVEAREARRLWWESHRRGVFVAAVVVLLSALLLWRGCRAAPEEDAGEVVVSVEVAKAERGAIANEITAVATLAPRNEAVVMPKISAPIAQMGLIVNRTVHAGEVLAVLESRDLAAQRAEAAGAVTELEAAAHATASGSVPLTDAEDAKAVRDARALLENASRTLDRRKALFAQGGISKKELEASELAVTQAADDLRNAEAAASIHRAVTNPGDVTVAEAKARQARDRLAALDAQLGYAAVRAPFDGVVTEQFQHQGDFAVAGTKMLTLADASTLIAKTEVSAATAATLKPGDAVKVLPDELPGQVLEGTISLVGRGADVESRSVEVWAIVPNPALRLRPNGSATVIIAAQNAADAVVVPSSAVTLDATNGTSGTVMAVDARSIAHEVQVTTGLRSGGRTQITSGLNGGETVVTVGNYGLPDGTKVAVAGKERD